MWSAGLGVFEGLAIENGLIVATGPAALELSGEVIDLNGGFLAPGFIDGHAHPIFAGREARGPKVNNLQSIDEIKKKLRDMRKRIPMRVGLLAGLMKQRLFLVVILMHIG